MPTDPTSQDNDDSRPEGADPAGSDLDAQFAAMMEGLSLPEEMRADLEALDAQRHEDPFGPGGVDSATVPRNTYGQPTGAATEAPDDDLPVGRKPTGPKAVKVAVVLTPVRRADALASLCAVQGLDCIVVPASSGALAVKEFVSAHAEWDVSELLGGVESEPAEAAELAAELSRLSRGGAVLLTADLATDVGIETGLSGAMTARRYVNGEAGDEASAALLLAAVDQVAEDILLGIVSAQDAPGAIRTSEVQVGRGMRWLGRGLRGRRGPAGD